jgi:acetolactate synthase-1/3 small subunit
MSKTSTVFPRPPYSSATARSNVETHTLSVLVDNESGVLAHVVGMFSGRGYNIESLTVAEVAHETPLSRITIITLGTPEIIEQIRRQLEQLVRVHSVKDPTLIERELATIRVRVKGENRVDVMRLADAFQPRQLSPLGVLASPPAVEANVRALRPVL